MENGKVKLCSLIPGQWGTVAECEDNGRNIAARLRDMGLTNGSVVECVMKSPLGEPTAYLIKGCVIALRQEDAATVTLNCICEKSELVDGKRGDCHK